jgi:hypothetical protein
MPCPCGVCMSLWDRGFPNIVRTDRVQPAPLFLLGRTHICLTRALLGPRVSRRSPPTHAVSTGVGVYACACVLDSWTQCGTVTIADCERPVTYVHFSQLIPYVVSEPCLYSAWVDTYLSHTSAAVSGVGVIQESHRDPSRSRYLTVDICDTLEACDTSCVFFFFAVPWGWAHCMATAQGPSPVYTVAHDILRLHV